MAEPIERLSRAEQAIAERLIDEIDRHNVAATGITARELLAAETDERGELLGGVYGWSWGGTCWIEALWVREDARSSGLGTRMLHAAEDIARDRRCSQLALETHSFQAPDFYARHGFEVVGTLPDYPAGHDHVVMRKLMTS
jgi:GNAT superfamily N-acetyltransferase